MVKILDLLKLYNFVFLLIFLPLFSFADIANFEFEKETKNIKKDVTHFKKEILALKQKLIEFSSTLNNSKIQLNKLLKTQLKQKTIKKQELDALESDLKKKELALKEINLLLKETQKDFNESINKKLSFLQKIKSSPNSNEKETLLQHIYQYIFTISRYFTYKLKELELKQVLARMEYQYTEKLVNNFKNNIKVTKEEIKKISDLTKLKTRQLEETRKVLKSALKKAELKEQHAHKLKSKALSKIKKAKSKIARTLALIDKQIAEAELMYSETLKLLTLLKQRQADLSLKAVKTELNYLKTLNLIRNNKFSTIQKLTLKKEILTDLKSLKTQKEEINKTLSTNLKAIELLQTNLANAKSDYAGTKNSKVKYKLRKLISIIKNNIKERESLSQIILKSKSILSKVSNYNLKIIALLEPSKKSIFTKITTNYSFQTFIHIKNIAYNIKSLFLSSINQIKLDFEIFLKSKIRFLKIPAKIYFLLLLILTVCIFRKFITLKLKSRLNDISTLYKRMDMSSSSYDRNYLIIVIMKKISPFLLLLFTALIILKTLKYKTDLYQLLLLPYFSIFLFYTLKYTFLEFFTYKHKAILKIISERTFLHIKQSLYLILIISFLFLNIIKILEIIAPSLNINIIWLIYQGLLAIIISLMLLKREIFEQIIPESQNLLFNLFKKFISNFYHLIIIFIFILFFLYAVGYVFFVGFVLKGIILSVAALILSYIIFKKINKYQQQKIDLKDEKTEYKKLAIKTTIKLAEIAIYIFTLLTILYIWGVRKNHFLSILKIFDYQIPLGSIKLSITNIIKVCIIFYLAYLISKVVRNLLKYRIFKFLSLDAGIENSLLTAAHYFIVVIAVILGLDSLGIGIEGFKWLAGFIGIGLGFGLQNIVNNFISGIILLFERPIKIGDFVKVGEYVGTIKKISVRSTIIETPDNLEIIVPNSDFISNNVVNYTHSNTKVRLHIPVGVAYGSDIQLVKKILLDIANNHGLVLKSPPPAVYFTDFADSSLNFKLIVWIQNLKDMLKVPSDLRFAIDKAFRKYNIEIPFPQQDIYIRNIPDELKNSLLELINKTYKNKTPSKTNNPDKKE